MTHARAVLLTPHEAKNTPPPLSWRRGVRRSDNEVRGRARREVSAGPPRPEAGRPSQREGDESRTISARAGLSYPASFPVELIDKTSTLVFPAFRQTGHRSLGVLLLIALAMSGCTRFDDRYGETSGASGKQSVNGFGAFRTVLEEDVPISSEQEPDTAAAVEVRSRNMIRLSHREQDNDAIVWIPKSWPPTNESKVTAWMQQWLKRGDRTLVFVVPDEGSTEEYFRNAAEVAPPEQRLAYRRRLAKQINQRIMHDVERENIAVDDWFVAQSLPYRTRLPGRRISDFHLVPDKTTKSKANQADDSKASESGASTSEDESSSGAWEEALTDVFDWVQSQSRQHQTPKPDFDVLMKESVTTLARIRDPSWHDSQILVVASGGLVTNFAMTCADAQQMAVRIQSEIHATSNAGDDARIELAFLSSDSLPMPISEAKPGVPKSKGWELMTEMPLGLVNMHIAFLGIVLCLTLLPIFGRPRRVRYNRVTHFGNHLSAMATLMRRGGGTVYARQRISDYLRKIRGETSGPWVLPEPEQPISHPPSAAAAPLGTESPHTPTSNEPPEERRSAALGLQRDR